MDPADLLGAPQNQLHHPDDLPLVIDAFADAMQTGRAEVEFRVRHCDGSWRWLELTCTNLLHDPDVEGLVLTGRDITVRKRAEDAVPVREISERKRAEEELARQALSDTLTGLANRALLLDRVKSALARSERKGRLTAVLFLDIDHFKLVNDSLGHAVGDQLLMAVADRLQGFVRKGDTAARLGGDEFVLCCENLESYGEAADVADRLADVLGEPMTLDGQEMSVTVSIGITCACDEGRTPEDLLRDADV